MNTYNALGQRVEDITPTSTTDEAYGAGGNLLLRHTGDSNSRSFVPFNGRILAEYYCGGMIFDHPDEIGSLTTSTDCTGNTVNEKLFYPFGELWTGAAIPNLGAHQTFAQLPDYDPETDQYNTDNRHYSPSGRWMSPDPGGLKYVHMDDPQTWNLYAYVRNNPTTLTDPTGLEYGSSYNSSGNFQCATTGCAPNTSMSAETLPETQGTAQNQNSQEVPPEVKSAIANSVNASNSPTEDDKKAGKLHEEGGVWGTDIGTGNTIVSPAKPGPTAKPGDKEVHMEVGNAVNPSLNQQMIPQGEWHVHPQGRGGRSFVQPPSDVDKANAVFKVNIVVGAGNKRVYIYNGSGVVREMSLKQFLKEP